MTTYNETEWKASGLSPPSLASLPPETSHDAMSPDLYARVTGEIIGYLQTGVRSLVQPCDPTIPLESITPAPA
ncbi:MAG TPA: hypothetical protein VFE62_02860 [Gemmataceae bacterium]|nr:hypothetical protein [Gemmataceae bacterium]